MRSPLAVAFAALFALAAGHAAAAVGFQHLSIPNPQGGEPIEVGVWYPTDAAAKPEPLELYMQDVAPDAPVKGDRLPLVVISHGHGGSFAGHYDTAIALAEAGFVAASLTHPGDNWHDQSLATRIWERPRQLKALTDYMVDRWPGHARIDTHRIGAFGFSAGGFTVLAEAGGVPDLKTVRPHCIAHPQFETCQVVREHPLPDDVKPNWTHDDRIRAIVSAAPAVGFAFGKQGLREVRVPVQLWRGADDQVLPHPYYAEQVRLDLPRPPEMHVIEGAGHYDFIPPCSAQMAQRIPLICHSKPGFDRAAFHQELNRDVVRFFEDHLR